MNIPKLEKIFQREQTLTSTEMNAITGKIDEIINALSSIGTGSSGSGSGSGSQYDDSDIREALERLEQAIAEANATADQERERLDGVINDINDTVEQRVNKMLTDKDFLDELKEGVQSQSNFGEDDVENYLQRIGVIRKENGQITYAWSTIAQDVNSLRASVNNLIQSGVDQEALQAAINAKIDQSIASLDISTMYARKSAESIIEWLYSALKSETSPSYTFNELSSAGQNALQNAIADIRTEVTKGQNGEYVATASLEAKVDDAIAGLISSASSNTVKTEIVNKLTKNSNDIASIASGITGSQSTTDIVNKIGTWKATLATKAALNEATAELMATNDFTAAAIVAKVNEAGSSIKINADKINLQGHVWADDIDTNAIKTSVLNALNMNIGGGTLTIGGNDGYSEVYFDVSGNSSSNNVGVSISNDRGLEIMCDENTSGETGWIRIGNTSGQFGIYSNHQSGYNQAQSGIGYNGVINGAKFINGICVGPNAG